VLLIKSAFQLKIPVNIEVFTLA